MMHRVLFGFACGLALAGAAIADTAGPIKTAETPAVTQKVATVPAKPVKSAKTIKPMQMTCEEFLSYDEITRPQIVFLSEGLNGKGKPDNAVFDIERTNTLGPVLIEDCKREPKTSYWQKMKNEFKKIL